MGNNITAIDLFSGLGLFSLAAELVGWKPIQFVEKDKFRREVLSKRFPGVPVHDLIETYKPKKYAAKIIYGGDPCQPSSLAGLGKGQADHRFLWPEMLRIIRTVRPVAVLNENVDGTIANGILDLKADDLESEGYTCQAYSIPAEAVGAMHKRQRIWLVAYHPDILAECRASGDFQSPKQKIQKRDYISLPGKPVDLWAYSTDPDPERWEKQHNARESGIQPEEFSLYFGFGPSPYGHIPRDILESGIIGMLNGYAPGMEYADRHKRCTSIGDSIVWQIAFEIFQIINQIIYGQTRNIVKRRQNT